MGGRRNLDGFDLMLSAEDILSSKDDSLEKVSVPEWGGDVFVRTMTGGERDSWELYASKQMERANNVNIRAKLACLCLCDENGKRLFGDGQVDALGKKSAKALDRVYSAALELNKLTDEDIEQLEKN